MGSEKVSRETSAASGAVTVTASDSTVFDPPGRAVYVGATGNLAVRMAGDQSVVTFVGVQTGALLPIAVDKVMSTNTTATSILLLR
jgi:hypothetical protein